MKTPAEIETFLGLPPLSLTVSTDEQGRPTYSPPLTPEQLARLRMAEAGPAFSVSPAQLREALIDAGISPEAITAAFNAIADPTAKAKALARWEYATAIERGHPLIAQMAAAFGLSSEQVDALFVAAATL